MEENYLTMIKLFLKNFKFDVSHSFFDFELIGNIQ